MIHDLPILPAHEARVLGCLIEKKETTPDIYPLTLNALQSAANQKTSREPVMSLEASDIHRALKQLEQKGLVRQNFGTRVERFSLTQPQVVILGLLLLRGPQTAYELLSRSERMAHIGSIEELRSNLDLMIGRRPPLIVEMARAPGQREERFAHLLSGEPAPVVTAPSHAPASAYTSDLEERVRVLEEQVAELRAKIQPLIG
jgi:uncharacterized protein